MHLTGWQFGKFDFLNIEFSEVLLMGQWIRSSYNLTDPRRPGAAQPGIIIYLLTSASLQASEVRRFLLPQTQPKGVKEQDIHSSNSESTMWKHLMALSWSLTHNGHTMRHQPNFNAWRIVLQHLKLTKIFPTQEDAWNYCKMNTALARSLSRFSISSLSLLLHLWLWREI